MRRQSLRPRQIDIHARMRIIRSAEDLEVDDDGASSSTGVAGTGSQPHASFEELVAGLEDYSSASKHAAAAANKRKKKNIPIPIILTVDSYDDAIPDDFVIPTSYVRFQALPQPSSSSIDTDSQLQKIEMDLELAEIKWLRKHVKYGVNGDPRYQLTLDQLAKMLDVLEKASALINPNVITLAEAEEVLAKQLGMVRTPLNKATVDVYNYWAQKRLALKRPLLRKYWPQTPLNDTNPHLVFRPREKERYKLRKHRKNDMDGYRKLQQLRTDFERIRHLMDLVKRREKAKRLQIDFLDETRRQAIHELTVRDGSVRKPVIPIDEERERQKKNKKKKKKKHRRDSEDNIISGGIINGTGSDGSAAGNLSADTSKPTGITAGGAADLAMESGRILTFMEYDTSQNFRMCGEENDPELSIPYYPSYPMSSSHIMASMFMQPPKYRCRGRIGRGGRLVVDRIPVPSSRYYAPTEINATMAKFAQTSTGQNRSTSGGNIGNGAVQSESQAASMGEAINSGHGGAILVHETSFRPLMAKLEQVTTKRVEEIYNMSDSEDEFLEPLTSSVYETTTSRKSASGSGSSAGGGKMHPNVSPPHMLKFALDI